MVKRIGGQRRKSRSKLKKNVRQKGKLSLTKYFQSFKKGDKVKLVAEPSVQRGAYFMRFHGRTGVVAGKRGSCYEISVKDIKKEKTIIVHPVHLKRT